MALLQPDLYYRDVHSIDLDALAAEGRDTLLIDLDNTLLPRDASDVPEDLRAWASSLSQRGMSASLVSNNWHAHVKSVADELGFALVSKAIKPLPFAFLRALGLLDSDRHRAAVIGDQIFTDILGGNLLGMRTVLVMPLSATDLPHTLALRRLEALVLAGRQPLP
ncbi:MAG: YqeG family HAD IIIA-type phosphatase [Actinomycetota bacterium]|nr:YqeG family HAD IIIA-type phosphatase [Actinomycetota bacterium]MDZ4180370.1 YqeG family HAD IIIA-type phosphatase [Coriobacteriia bacterium]